MLLSTKNVIRCSYKDCVYGVSLEQNPKFCKTYGMWWSASCQGWKRSVVYNIKEFLEEEIIKDSLTSLYDWISKHHYNPVDYSRVISTALFEYNSLIKAIQVSKKIDKKDIIDGINENNNTELIIYLLLLKLAILDIKFAEILMNRK